MAKLYGIGKLRGYGTYLLVLAETKEEAVQKLKAKYEKLQDHEKTYDLWKKVKDCTPGKLKEIKGDIWRGEWA